VLDAQRLARNDEDETRAVGKSEFREPRPPYWKSRRAPETTLQYVAEHRTPGALDTAGSATRGVWLQGRATSPRRVEIVSRAPFGIGELVEKIRRRIRETADSGPGQP